MSSLSREKFYALGRLKQGQMNKTEAAYAEHLELLKRGGEILWWKFEPVKFKLADNTHYNPDFMVVNKNREVEIHEVKGFWRDDARCKIKIAADMYPMKFIAVKLRPKNKGGGWQVEEF